MDTKICDIVIIGAGPAGMTAGIYCARAGLRTVIIEKLAFGGQTLFTFDIANYPGFLSITGADLAMKMQEQALAAGVEIVYDEIETLDLDRKYIRCKNEDFSCSAIIVCTGAGPRKLGIEGEEEFTGVGIHYCGLCDGAFYTDKDVVVVGGGNSAVEEVLFLAAVAKSITIVNVTSNFNAEAVSIAKLNQLDNVRVFHNHAVEKAVGTNKVNSIIIKNVLNGQRTTLDCEGVFINIGRIPSNEFVKKLSLSKEGYIKVDSNMATSIKGVFAAGDIVEKTVRQIITACGDGAVAAVHAVEYTRKYR